MDAPNVLQMSLNRRRTLMAALLAGFAAPAASSLVRSAAAFQSDGTNSAGTALPEDAAAADRQVFRYAGIEGKHFDMNRNIYESSGMNGYAWEPLVWLDADYNAFPGAAESWDVSEDGLTWTFALRENAAWNDGTPITADDWVYSMQRMLSPELANPYGWFYASIKNAAPFSAGELADPNELGVVAIDDYTLAISTEQPIPFFLMVLGFIATIAPKHMIEAHGDEWASDPATALSNGPYQVAEWNKGRDVVFTLNPHYQGPATGLVERVTMTFIPQANTPTLPMYQANEVDWLNPGGPELLQAMNDSELSQELETYPHFATFYMYFNDTEPPFNDVRVRQAFSHAIDRDAIANQVMQGLDVPAYTLLPAGFPSNQADDPEIQAIQAFDPERAKALLAEAGYPDGEGFPEFEMWTRQGQIVTEGEAIQRMLQEHLGVKVQARDVERSVYMDTLAAHDIQLGLIQWVADYADPTNFMDWWATQSRHTWTNEEYNALITEARGELDPARRTELYNQAERILIEDVAGVFIASPILGALWKSRIGGIRQTEAGVRKHYTMMWSDIYVKDE